MKKKTANKIKIENERDKNYSSNVDFNCIGETVKVHYGKEKNKILLQCLKDSQERCENEHLFLGNPDM